MIRLTDISQKFKGKDIFSFLNWNIKKNKKYGLVGPNGTGKTTLLEIVSGLLEADSGSVDIPRNIVIGYLTQELNYELKERTVVEEALEGLSENFKSMEIDNLRYKAEKILMGLGFSIHQFNEPATTLSGGWKMRIELAKILLKVPNLLLLDEPTNHLDIQSIEWIEDYLNNFSGTIVIVSHDKYLLDRMVNTIAELENGVIREFAGNYSKYLSEKENIKQIQLSTFKNQQKKIQQTERFIERFRYKNTKAKQVQSRIKMLEKMEIIEEPDSGAKSIKLKFPEAPRSGKVVYELSKFSKNYNMENGEVNVVFQDSGPLKIERGDRVALAGRNGEGKTTLAKIVVGAVEFNGESKLGHNVELAYYAQNQTETLNLEKNVYDELRSVALELNETQIRSILGSFLFNEGDLEKKVKVLSGGEKSRVTLSKMLVSPSNFLILDEPTNHLDIQSKEVLLEALKSYSGTFLIISHDRYFIDQLVNKVWYVENTEVHMHLGNYSGFIEKYRNRLIKNDEKHSPEDQTLEPVVNNKTKEAEDRNKLYRELKEKGIENMENWKDLSKNQLAKAVKNLEKTIEDYESKKEEIEKLLSDPEFFKKEDEAVQKTKDLDILNQNLKVMYERWDEINEYLE